MINARKGAGRSPVVFAPARRLLSAAGSRQRAVLVWREDMVSRENAAVLLAVAVADVVAAAHAAPPNKYSLPEWSRTRDLRYWSTRPTAVVTVPVVVDRVSNIGLIVDN
jgi:hypothetical protein